MRTPSIGSVQYAPTVPPTEQSDFNRWVQTEFDKVAAAISALALGHLDKSFVSPVKPRDGDIRYADGTSWNPGSGQGVYYYNGTAWVLLG